jgi:CRISPR/Cas system-associated exonuclease Cas4 (RecB family)
VSVSVPVNALQEPAQHQDALFEYWLSNSAAKPVQSGAGAARVPPAPGAATTEPSHEPRQGKKALLFGHLAELQRRGRPVSASACALDADQPNQPQLTESPKASEPAEPSLACSGLTDVDVADEVYEDLPRNAVGSPSPDTASVAVEKEVQKSIAPSCEPLSRADAQVGYTGAACDSPCRHVADQPLPAPQSKVVQAEQACRRLVLETAQTPEVKTLRLLDASTGTISVCELREQWSTSPVVSGDVVNIVGARWDSRKREGVVDNEDGYVILHPDTLVTGTRVAQSFDCQRKVVLGAKLSSSISSVAAMRGTMLHELFEAAVTARLETEDEYEAAISTVLTGSMQALYATGENEESTRLYLRQHVRLMMSWVNTYLQPGSEMVDGRTIHSVLHAEENIWSPQFGLKGKVDLSVSMRTTDHRSDIPAALELKTGRQNPQEHQAQVMLYSLLMSQRYGVDVDSGLLLYLSLNLQDMRSVGHSRASVIGIIMQRNNIALHLRTIRGDTRCRDLPAMIMNEHQCGRCFQKDSCMLYHRAMEGGSAGTSGVEAIFDGVVGHLSDRQVDYCRSYLRMIGAF